MPRPVCGETGRAPARILASRPGQGLSVWSQCGHMMITLLSLDWPILVMIDQIFGDRTMPDIVSEAHKLDNAINSKDSDIGARVLEEVGACWITSLQNHSEQMKGGYAVFTTEYLSKDTEKVTLSRYADLAGHFESVYPMSAVTMPRCNPAKK